LRLSDVALAGLDGTQLVVNELSSTINKKSLEPLSGAVLTRLPKSGSLIQRSHTFVPGGDAYAEVSEPRNSIHQQHYALAFVVSR
jgi:hypothetical protein